MKRNKKKGRPIAAGSPGKPIDMPRSEQVSAPIVPRRDPFVKWLESLQPGTLFQIGKRLCTVAAVKPVQNGRMITLAVAHGRALNPPIGARGGVRHG